MNIRQFSPRDDHAKDIIALVVTFNPDEKFGDRLDLLCSQFGTIILVDNGSEPGTLYKIKQQTQLIRSQLKFIQNDQNLGVATALNQGFFLAIQLGGDFVVAFDQDSLPAPDMIKELSSAYASHLERERIAVIAPVVEDPSAGILARYLRPKHSIFFERAGCSGQTLEDVSMVITSGAMHDLRIYQQVGPFRDAFFIDYVDTEYCFRAHKMGFKIIVACNARLRHKLGNQKKFRLGPLEIRPTFHSPVRWYYISRNRISMIREYGLRFPHWLVYELVINGYGFLRMLFFEDQKHKKILALLFGTLDGMTGRTGMIPEDRKRILEK